MGDRDSVEMYMGRTDRKVTTMNDDTISRAAALSALNGCTEIYLNNLPPTIYKGDAVDAIKALPSAQPGWIPVTEKPIECGQYIVTLKDDKEVWTDIAEWNPTFGGRWQAEFFDCEYRDINNVVAWQPLPTPYREGGQDDSIRTE